MSISATVTLRGYDLSFSAVDIEAADPSVGMGVVVGGWEYESGLPENEDEETFFSVITDAEEEKIIEALCIAVENQNPCLDDEYVEDWHRAEYRTY